MSKKIIFTVLCLVPATLSFISCAHKQEPSTLHPLKLSSSTPTPSGYSSNSSGGSTQSYVNK